MNEHKEQNLVIYRLVKELWGYFPKGRQKSFKLVLLLTIFSSFMELVSVGSFLPFLEVLVDPASSKVLGYVKEKLGNSFLDTIDPLLSFTILFIVIIFFSGFIRILLLIVSTRVSFQAGSELSVEVYKKTLAQPYIVHLSRNSSDVISGVLVKSKGLISGCIMPILNSINGILLILFLVLFIANLNLLIFSVTFSIFVGLYVIVSMIAKKKIELLSKIIAKEQSLVLKSLTEGLGGIRDVILGGYQEFYTKLYQDSDRNLKNIGTSIYIIGSLPRYIIEVFALLIMTIVAFIAVNVSSGISTFIPVLGVITLGAQRLLPSLHSVYQSWVTIKGHKYYLRDTLDFLGHEMHPLNGLENGSKLSFNEKIEIKNLSFSYNQEGDFTLNDINLVIKKGSKIGIIGTTGSGKSTLLDIIMGLLEPTKGEIIVDGKKIENQNRRAWQNIIGHVPQSIFLSDSSIAENIAFGISPNKIEMEKVLIAGKKADIHSHIAALPNGYKTKIGERGIRLSGGQKQRLGIARALYKDAKLLLFDEATSALDTATEKVVMEFINNLNITILIVAHRLTTISECDLIVELKQGKIIQIYDKFEDIVRS